MNMLQEHIREFINPYPNRYTRGEYEIRVLPHEDLDDEGIEKYCACSRSFLTTLRQQQSVCSLVM